MEKRCCTGKKSGRRGRKPPSGLKVTKRNLERIHPNKSGGKKYLPFDFIGDLEQKKTWYCILHI